MGIPIFRLNFCLSLDLIEQYVWISDKIEWWKRIHVANTD